MADYGQTFTLADRSGTPKGQLRVQFSYLSDSHLSDELRAEADTLGNWPKSVA